MSLDQIDKEFAQFARQRATKIAPGATWEEPELPADANSAAIPAWLESIPRVSRACGDWRRGCCRGEMAEGQGSFGRVKALYPDYVGPDNPYLLLAIVYRRLSDPAAEHKVLEELAMRDGDAIPAYLRLMELDEAAGDWRGVAECEAVPGGQSAGSDAAP